MQLGELAFEEEEERGTTAAALARELPSRERVELGLDEGGDAEPRPRFSRASSPHVSGDP
jgi:hypothetical protein